jgi:hypothetical protein
MICRALITNLAIRDIGLLSLWLVCRCDNFERIAWRLVSFLINDDFFLSIWSFYWLSSDRLRIDHAFLALAKVDSTRTLWLIRLLAENLIARIVRKITKSDFAVFDDRSSCLTSLSLFWSANQLFHSIFRTDRLWRNENRSRIKFICSVFDSIAWWTWSILDFYDQLTSWSIRQIQ